MSRKLKNDESYTGTLKSIVLATIEAGYDLQVVYENRRIIKKDAHRENFTVIYFLYKGREIYLNRRCHKTLQSVFRMPKTIVKELEYARKHLAKKNMREDVDKENKKYGFDKNTAIYSGDEFPLLCSY